MYVMVDIRATGMTGIEFAEALLEEHLVAVMPGESFGKAAAGHVRIALTVDDARSGKGGNGHSRISPDSFQQRANRCSVRLIN